MPSVKLFGEVPPRRVPRRSFGKNSRSGFKDSFVIDGAKGSFGIEGGLKDGFGIEGGFKGRFVFVSCTPMFFFLFDFSTNI